MVSEQEETLNRDANLNLDRIWNLPLLYPGQICAGAQTALIQIEYAFAQTDTLDYFKVWSSLSRGHWLLACEYWMSSNRIPRYRDPLREWIRIRRIGSDFGIRDATPRIRCASAEPGRQGLLQISTPTLRTVSGAAAALSSRPPSIVWVQLSLNQQSPEVLPAYLPNPPTAGPDAVLCG